jgi:pectate lyase
VGDIEPKWGARWARALLWGLGGLLAACGGGDSGASASVSDVSGPVDTVQGGFEPTDAAVSDLGAGELDVVDLEVDDASAEPPDVTPAEIAAVEEAATADDTGAVEVVGPEEVAEPDETGPTDVASATDETGPADDTGGEDAPDATEPLDASPSGPGEPFHIEGFGAGTLGGWQPGHDVYTVTTLADTGPGSLRDGLQTGGAPRVIVFDVDGPIVLSGPLLIPSNVTLDGRGHDVALTGKGVVFGGADQVILVNLAFVDIGPDSEDGVQIGSPDDPAEHVVLDHLRFEQHGDGGDSKNVDEAISVVFGARAITISWCRFVNWEKIMLFGNGDASAALDGQIRLTVHHCWAQATGRRHPQARFGVYDLYNNFWDDWRMYGWFWEAPYRESFGAQAQDGARMRFENNLARRDTHPFDMASQANDVTRCESGGEIDEIGTVITADSSAPLALQTGCPATPEAVLRPYPATVDPADDELRARLEAETGDTL